MADEPINPSPGPTPSPAPAPEPAAPRQSMREIAEASWDEVEGTEPAAPADPAQDAAGQAARARDTLGRFAPADQAAKPGEQSQDPAPKPQVPAPGVAKPVDPALGSNQPPQHWSEQDRQTFSTLPPAGQEFLLRRHTEMERDYQGKAQAAATAVQFTQSLAPIFQDPVVAGSLQQAGVSPYDAIGQWASFHKRAADPNPAVRDALLVEMAQRMGRPFPAANGQLSPPGFEGLSEADLKDPAIKSFADHIGKTYSEVQTLRGELHQMRQQEQQKVQAEVLKVNRWSVDSFADEKDAQGNLKHPHFDAVLPHMIELYRANPERDLQEAYEYAIWSVPSTRQALLAAERSGVQQQHSNERARQAVRSNVRGVTSPVAKPADDGKAKGMRAMLEASADEVGL